MLKISPSIVEESVTKGEKLTFTIDLQNMGAHPLRVKGFLSDVSMNEDGILEFGDGISNRSCRGWLSFSPDSLKINPGEVENVLLTGQVPFRIGGGYYAVLLFEITPKDDYSDGGVRINLTSGLIIALNVQPGSRLRASIEKFQIEQAKRQTILKVQIVNHGNVHIRPIGSIVIYDWKEKVIDRLKLTENNFILPGSRRVLTFLWDQPDKRKINETYTAECRFSVQGLGISLRKKEVFSTFEN